MLRTFVAASAFLAVAMSAHARFDDRIDVDSATPRNVEVQLQGERGRFGPADDVTVLVSFTNAGAQAVALTKWFVPGDEFDEPVFEVTRNGVPVEYMGPLVKRAEPTAGDLLWLQPGEQLTIPVELSGTYDMSAGGDFNVRYRASSVHLFSDAQGRVESLASRPLVLSVETRAYSNVRAVAGDGYKAAGAGGVTYTGRCSLSQQSALLDAVSAASTMSGGALSYLTGNSPSATARYTTWFGAFSSSGWTTAKTHFSAISNAFDTKPITLDCGCKKSYYAYVYPTQPYKIYVCKAFWTAPLTGTDSKGGTLVHEMSHFTVTASTDDWAYGQSAAKSLALSDPAKALDNADSHEYFSENTPAQQ